MRAVVISQQGTPVHENVRFVDDWPDLAPRAGHVLIRTEASALNHLDLWVGRGLPGIDLDYPRIGGSDICGIVESVGDGVDAQWVGQRVIMNAAVPQSMTHRPGSRPALPEISMIGEHTNGAHAQYLNAPVQNVQPVGDRDPVDAAAFGLTFLTAWRCLITRAGLQAGDILLIPGIGGGVATAALAIAGHMGCTTIVTSRHQHKLDAASKLGADHTILDTGEDWSRAVRTATGKRGVDVVLDSVGDAVHLACIKSLARGGTLVTPGCTSGPSPNTDLARIFWNQLRIVGSTMGSNDEFAQVTALFRAGHLSPVVDQVFEPSDAPQAYERLEKGEQFGKLVLRWS